MDSPSSRNDLPPFLAKNLRQSAKTYRNFSKGSDHWLASEFDLPNELLEPIASAIDSAVVMQSWPRQMLMIISPELGEDSGGVPTIAKTPNYTVSGHVPAGVTCPSGSFSS